jgi:hypothetical protein
MTEHSVRSQVLTMSFTALGCKVDPLLRLVTDAGGRTTRGSIF